MKYFILLLVVLCSFGGWAQKKLEPLNESESSGTTLAKHWKWHRGDNPAWASLDLVDSTWEAFSPTKSIHKLPSLREAQIAWFRRPIKITQALVNKPLALSIDQVGASEIYIDGKLLKKLGVVSIDSKKEVTHSLERFIPFSLPDTNLHVIAVRFSYTKSNFYYPGNSQETFELKFDQVSNIGEIVYNSGIRKSEIFYLAMGIFLVFAVLHFSFYASNRARKVSLSLGFTMLTFAVAFLLENLEQHQSNSSLRQVYQLVELIAFYAGFILINTSLYLYLSQPFRVFFYLQLGLIVGSVICLIFGYDVPIAVEVWLAPLLIFVDFIRVSILADRRRDPNAKVPIYSLIIGAAFFALAIMIVIAGSMMVDSYNSSKSSGFQMIIIIAIVLWVLMFFSIPVGLSFSLVKEYSRTHQALRKKLQEVEKLSAQNLAHEQEKQQILAAQNEILERQVAERTAELHESLEELKATQAQLIQSEKLASLGELTAGIAHEIQNPLNFVNNFSELSIELLEELQEEKRKINIAIEEDSLEEEIFGDLVQNLEKINHHGKRASSIVKGMLEHSRNHSGTKEMTDLNNLTDEYLRLAYHGMRAKDKTFNSDFKANLDPLIPKIEVVGQDIGRVILNLTNNAFYAVHQKALQKLPSYKPLVEVSTQLVRNAEDEQWIEVRVKDNGTGIPDAVKSKIFQPFFTTKPTGQGTGLGLSLAYDIVTKGHSGEMSVESQAGEGTEFVFRLPVS
ncbi:MAG: ATP-binding protein [Runella zeae]